MSQVPPPPAPEQAPPPGPAQPGQLPPPGWTAPADAGPGSVYNPSARQTNQLAIISVAAGAASYVVVPFIGAIVAIVTGHMARRQIRRTGEDGAGLALAGLILGYVHLALFALLVLIVLLIFGAVIFAAGHAPSQ